MTGFTATSCSHPTCGAVLDAFSPCHRDEVSSLLYCTTCGPILRYHRKKALERGEEIPVTIGEALAHIERMLSQ